MITLSRSVKEEFVSFMIDVKCYEEEYAREVWNSYEGDIEAMLSPLEIEEMEEYCGFELIK